MIKIIIIWALVLSIFLPNMLLAEEISIVNDNPINSQDIGTITFSKFEGYYKHINIYGSEYTYSLSAPIIGSVEGIIIDGISSDFDEATYKVIHLESDIDNMENNNSIVVEMQDITNTEAYGFLYISKQTGRDSMPQFIIDTLVNFIYPTMDSVFAANGWPLHGRHLLNGGRRGAKAYVISFDQPNPYESGYTLAELDYEYIYQNSATDYLEKILDTDRNNELVGFRYYSDLNVEEYTIFIKANN